MKPYISIVVTSRNDDHGGEMFQRMCFFLKGVYHQFNKYKLPAEIVFVEWNNQIGKKHLHETLPQPPKTGFVSVKHVIVPPSFHNKSRFASVLGLYQMIAKNVGIRRAGATLILCSNVDVLFSDPLVSFLAGKELDQNSFYRANRADVSSNVYSIANIDEQLKYCEANKIRVLGKHKMGLFDRAYLLKPFRSKEQFRIEQLDTVACGDFTLMHKDIWNNIKGYPELDFYSIHIDTMALLAADACGYKQVILPKDMCLYHAEHKNGWETLTPLERLHFIHERPGVGLDIVIEAGKQMMREKTTYSINRPDWGFANEKFDEVVFNRFE